MRIGFEVGEAAIKFRRLFRRQFRVISILLDVTPNSLREFDSILAAQL
jgi:hypothetical protein